MAQGKIRAADLDPTDTALPPTPGAWANITGGNAKFTTTASVPPQERLWAGWVEFAGRITVTGGAGITAADVICVLPTGHRPAAARRFQVVTSAGTSIITADTAGNVAVISTVAGVTNIDLDGARIRVA